MTICFLAVGVGMGIMGKTNCEVHSPNWLLAVTGEDNSTGSPTPYLFTALTLKTYSLPSTNCSAVYVSASTVIKDCHILLKKRYEEIN